MQPLVEKYRPKTINDFVGLDKPRAILSAFAGNPYPAAFLLLGSSGLGKTTMALALADQIEAEVLHVPSRKCDLETVQDLLQKCHYVPMFGKVWHMPLVDEADQMSRPAQHSFLSALDTTAFPPDTVFVFTANDTAALEDRFLSRVRTLKFSTEGIMKPGAAFLKKVWGVEARGKKVKPPDFEAIMREARLNIREALMILETEILCPGSFEAPALHVTSTEAVSKAANASESAARIYSIGYAGLTLPALREVLDALGVHLLVDVRSKPHSRIQGFSKSQLERALGERYQWAGEKLGGGGRTTPAGLTWLASLPAAGKTVCLLCKEEAPGNCHRHFKIAMPLAERGVPVLHIYNDDLILATELQESIDQDRDYKYQRWREPKAVA